MKPRWAVRALAIFLFVWEPLRVAGELLSSIASLGMRGPLAIVELIAHGAVAVLAIAASRALWDGAPHASRLAIAALIASAAVSAQTLYSSRLPQQTAPGQPLPFAILAVLFSTGWIVYLRRARH